ncbi:TIGR01906 family membrane protein [Clostridium drakei]|uniref:TIGR01906 family membrane protein n=1 Tax=Clostridium drakei TaxID=332101 RepID=A0A2U8DWF0_9CLOT|nr:TIGR01906 family membrane protein [Clostridium drakei]AWI07038.1 hypothetical protein B9W14_22045 [Clostridium drakei]
MKLDTYLKLIFSISISIFILLFSIKTTLNFKYLYYFDIKHLNIENSTSLSQKEIQITYDYLINYINGPQKQTFNIPTLNSSNEGKIHFLEVKNIFRKLNSMFFIFTIIGILGALYTYKYKLFSIFNWTSNLLLFICLFAWIPFYVNFNKSFNFFHETIFKNNYWLFDPNKDPVINILPEKYFFHCAISIILITLTGSLLLKILYLKNRNGK